MDGQDARALRVLMYHKVNDLEGNPLSVPCAIFDEQMTLLGDLGYTVVSLDAVLDHYALSTPLPEGAVLITFDDGYRDNLANAVPILRKHGYPAVLFVPIGYLDDRRPLPHEEHLAARGLLNETLGWVEFVERNYNNVELGPRGTGKSHLFQQVSPYSHLVSGGKATVARMFVNNASGQRGLVAQYDVVCFDEVSGVSFDQKDGVNIMKGYMESGEFSRGRESIRAEGSIVMVGNFDVDVQHQQRVGHLLSPLPPEMRNDTAFMDRLHSYAPGWDFPKLSPAENLTDHFGLVSDFLSECW